MQSDPITRAPAIAAAPLIPYPTLPILLFDCTAQGVDEGMSERIWLAAVVVVPVLGLTLLSNPAEAANGCKPGFVVREARAADAVCVTPASKARVAAENARAPMLWLAGPFGPKTCAAGFVWREAFVGDITCVTPAIRTVVRQENETSADRRE
jgi:hypothetical protein